MSLTLLAASCSDRMPGSDTANDTGSDASSTSADGGTTSTSASTTSTSAGSATTTTSATSSTTAATSTETGAESETTAITDGGRTDSSGGEGTTYSAVAIIGGLDRIIVFKRNADVGVCTYLTLVSPDGGGMFDAVDVTDPWSVEFANASDVLQACDSTTPGMFGGEAAVDATGSVALTNPNVNGFPCSVDIDVTLTFDGLIAPIPAMDTMSASGIAVDGC